MGGLAVFGLVAFDETVLDFALLLGKTFSSPSLGETTISTSFFTETFLVGFVDVAVLEIN